MTTSKIGQKEKKKISEKVQNYQERCKNCLPLQKYVYMQNGLISSECYKVVQVCYQAGYLSLIKLTVKHQVKQQVTLNQLF